MRGSRAYPAKVRGRSRERDEIGRIIAQAGTGHSAVVTVRGEAGIGKTTLLNHAREAASGFRVLHTAGARAETGFAFAGLHRLCAPITDRLNVLPEPQQDALSVALGRRTGHRPDPFLVGLATLGLLAEVAEKQPLLCLVDDAQWLDTVSLRTVAFVARRLDAEPLALVFGLREPASGDADATLADLPALRLDRLPDADARALLAAQVHEPLDDAVRDRILAEARGNPLALLELARHAPPAVLAGGLGLPDALSVPEGIEERYRQRVSSLPAATRMALLVAAAEPTGDPALFWRAAAHVGVEPQDTEPAHTAGLLDIGSRVRFTHPLARSAVYRDASAADRRLAHGAIAAATDATTDPDRRTWHRAHAVLGTDDEIASELVQAAQRALSRGGPAAAAVLLERSAELTPDPSTRARRTLDAAGAKYEAGAANAALDLLAVAASGPLEELHRARAELLRAQVAFHAGRFNDAPDLLLDAARQLSPFDTELSRDTYLHALEASMLAGASSHGRQITDVAEAALAAPTPHDPPRSADLLLDGLTTYHLHGYAQAVPALRRGVQAFTAAAPDPSSPDAESRVRWLACHTAMALWDDAAISELSDRIVRHDRAAGALTTLPFALNFRAAVLVHTGRLDRVEDLIDEADHITRATGGTVIPFSRLLLAAWRSDRDAAAPLYEAVVQDAARRGVSTPVTIADYARAVLYNGLGDYEAALAAAERVTDASEMVHARLALSELAEAAAYSGRPERAALAAAELTEQARVTGEPWVLGLAARSRALTADGPAASDLFREAVEHLSATRMTAHLARTRLLHGEWLRRAGLRREAREELREAHDLLSAMGADGFAARAAAELRATGEHPRKRSASTADTLTAQELRIARLIATGTTTKEAAAELFLSPRTIDAHLRNIFSKLSITSRRQLRDLQLG